MVQLVEADIRTKEVLDWKGLHLFHAPFSTCSQKLRMFMSMKRLHWTSHPIDLGQKENLTDWYLGINPRGLVPVLVDDGVVHLDSNDIMLHVERQFPTPGLIPDGRSAELQAALRFEDDLHLDIRTLSFLFLFNPSSPPKSSDDLRRYTIAGTGTVGGEPDRTIDREIGYWSAFGSGEIGDEQARVAAGRIRSALDQLEGRLTSAPFLMGDAFSILDIAWIVYANRLSLAGYPLARLHPQVAQWFDREGSRAGIAEELSASAHIARRFAARQAILREEGRTLVDVCFPGAA